MKLDFNSTSFSHPNSGTLSLSNPDKAVRDFWIEHTKRCRRIADAMGAYQGDPCIMNIWVHDGSKDYTVEKYRYRQIFKESLDEIMKEDLPNMKTCLEAKLFGIGLEAYTVGSHDFVAGYCAQNKMIYTLDTGHYEPTENVSDAVSALLLFVPELMLHVSRPMHWDSDHVTCFDDNTRNLFSELVRAGQLHRAHIGLDYFDASMTASAPTLSAPAPRRRACFPHSSSPSTCCVSMRTKASTLSAWPCWRRRKRCRLAPFTTISTTRTMCPWARITFQRLSVTSKR